MKELIVSMGPCFWLILLFAVIAVAVTAERLFYFHRVNINSGDFLRGLSALMRAGQYEEALHEVREVPGPMARVVESVLTRSRLERRELREIAMAAADMQVDRVERNIRALQACATLMPLLGILGALLALSSFYGTPGITDGAVAPPNVANTLQQVLQVTIFGVALSIPTYLFYVYLSSRARRIINKIERAGLECVYIICDARDIERSKESSPRPRGCCLNMAPEDEIDEDDKD